MKIFECVDNVGWRLTDKAFIKLWQTSDYIDDFKQKEKELWHQYKEHAEQTWYKREYKWIAERDEPTAAWTPSARASYLKRVGIPLKNLEFMRTEKQRNRAAHIEELKRYAVEVLNESR